jgi:hypothetical protein
MSPNLAASLSRERDEPHDGLRQASIRVEMDVAPNLVGRPRHFRKRLEQILALARTALADEVNDVASDGAVVSGEASPFPVSTQQRRRRTR